MEEVLEVVDCGCPVDQELEEDREEEDREEEEEE